MLERREGAQGSEFCLGGLEAPRSQKLADFFRCFDSNSRVYVALGVPSTCLYCDCRVECRVCLSLDERSGSTSTITYIAQGPQDFLPAEPCKNWLFRKLRRQAGR